jgi:geranylgeranyl diphosphate synthase type I
MTPSRQARKANSFEKTQRKELARQIQQLLEERGADTLGKVQEAILEEKIESQEIREALRHFLSYRHGFLVRPMLISLGCEAVGGKTDLVADVATPLVLMSGGMDIHDDIIDNQERQESRLTVFGKFNRDVALLTGDALLFKGLISWHKLVDGKLPIGTFMRMTQMLDEAFFEVGDGEALELALERRLDIDPAQYLSTVTKKAADIGVLLQIGAMLGNGSQDQIEALGRYGRSLGMLWILNDDLADMFDFKEMARIVKKGRLPLPVLYALRNSEIRDRLQDILSRKEITRKDAETILQMTIDGKGLQQAGKIMKTLASSGLKEVGKLVDPVRLTLLIQGSLVSLQIWEKTKLV